MEIKLTIKDKDWISALKKEFSPDIKIKGEDIVIKCEYSIEMLCLRMFIAGSKHGGEFLMKQLKPK